MFNRGMAIGVFFTIIMAALITSAIFLMMSSSMAKLTEKASEGSELLTLPQLSNGEEPEESACDEACQLYFKDDSYSGECRAGTVSPSGMLHVEGTKLYDENGNEVYLKGIQVHRNTLIATETFDEDDVAMIKSYSGNVMEFQNTLFVDVMPTRNQVDETYFLNYLDNWVSWCEKYEVYCIVSFGWFTYVDYNSPTWQRIPEWFWKDLGYASPYSGDVGDAQARINHARIIKDFYDPTVAKQEQNRQAWVNAWKFIAERYKDNQYALFGLTNEPFWDVHKLPEATEAMAQQFSANYNTLMRRAIDGIRQVGANQIIFIDPPMPGTWDTTFGGYYGINYWQPINRQNVVWEPHQYITATTDLSEWQDRLSMRINKVVNEFGEPVFVGEYWIDPASLMRIGRMYGNNWQQITSDQVAFLDSQPIVGRQLHSLCYFPIPHSHWYGISYGEIFTEEEAEWILETVLGGTTGGGSSTPDNYWGLVVSDTCWGWYYSGGTRVEYWGRYFGKTQIDMIKQSGATGIRIMLDKYAWDLGSTSNHLNIPYKDYIKQLVDWCKPELNVLLDLTRDSSSGGDWDTVNSATAGKGAVIRNYNGQRDDWINWGKEVISYCNPDAIGLMNEPRGGGGTITHDYYINNFVMPSINAYRTVKNDITIMVFPFPFYSTELFKNNPIDDPNVFYQWHLYYPQEYPYTGGHSYLNDAANAYNEGRLEDGKYWLYRYLDEFKFGNIPRSKIYWGEVGCYDNINGVQQWFKEPNQPNWEVWMNDCYEYARDKGMTGITQYAAGIQHYPIFDKDADQPYTTFTPYGELWADNMPKKFTGTVSPSGVYRGIGRAGFQYGLSYWHLDKSDFDFMANTFPENELIVMNFDCRELMPNVFESSPSYTTDSSFVSFLDNYMSWCNEEEIKVIVNNENPVSSPSDYWSNNIYRNGVAECFKYMANRYPNTILGFDPVNEPWQKIEASSDSDYIAHRNFVEYVIDAFRSVNPKFIAFVQGPRKHWRGEAMGWVRDYPIRRENIYYTFHLYSNNYDDESDWVNTNPAYVDNYYSWVADYKSGNYAAGKEKLKNELYSRWGFIKDLDIPYGHEIFLGEFAANPELSGGLQYLKDIISILNEWDASGSYYAWYSPEHRPMCLLHENHGTLRQGLVDTLNNNNFFVSVIDGGTGGGCQSGETSIGQDGCLSGQTCCCKPPEPTGCPSEPNYPTDRWDRVWCDMDFSEKLADTPDESSIQFDNNWGTNAVGGVRADQIGFRSGRRINFPATGTYTFTAGSDDGIRVWIDEQLELDMWSDWSYRTETFDVYLIAGYHNVRIDYYENGGNSRVSFSYTTPALGCDSRCKALQFASGECVAGTQPSGPTENVFGVFVWRGINDELLDQVKDLGVGWVEIGQSGRFDWRNDPSYINSVESVINRVRARGLRPIVRFATSDPATLVQNMDTFVSFVVDFVTRFNLDTIVVLDEPDVEFRGATPEDYAEVFRRVYPAVKSVAPNCVIIGGFGYERFWQTEEGTTDYGFNLERLRLAGFLDYVDALSIHGYDLPNVYVQQHASFREWLTAHGYEHIKIYVTGFSYTLKDKNGNVIRSELEQADLTVEAADIFSKFTDLEAMCYFYFENSPPGNEWSERGGTLLRHLTGEPKPVYYAYKDFIAENVPQTSKLRGIDIGTYDIDIDNVWSDNQIQYIADWGANSVQVNIDRTGAGFPVTKFGLVDWSFFDQIAQETERLGLSLVFRYSQAHWRPKPWDEDWYNWPRDKTQWLNDLKFIANRYKNYNHIYYDPYAENWGQPTPQEWQSYFQEAINTIEAIHPTAKFSIYPLTKGGLYNYGSMGCALDYPLTAKNEIVYTPHLYPNMISHYGIDPLDIDALRNYCRDTLRWNEARDKGLNVHIGEFGIGSTTSSEAMNMIKNMYQVVNEFGFGYHAWWWHTYASNPDYALLQDWNGNPKSPYGTFVQSQLTGGTVGACLSGETSIGEDGCPSGQICCCSGVHSFEDIVLNRATTSHSFQGFTLQEISENFDLLYSFPKWFGPKVQDLKTLNPDLIALLYYNFRAVGEEGRPDHYQLFLDNGWILRDSNDNIVRSTKWDQNVMVDIGNSSYQDFIVNWIKETINQYGYDGVFLDNGLSVRRGEVWFGVTGQPINPRTEQLWDVEDIKKAFIDIHNKLRQALGSKLIMANGIYNGQRFFQDTDRTNDYIEVITNSPLDGFMSEGMWYAHNGEWFTHEKWKDSLDFLVWVQDNFLTSDKFFKMDVTLKNKVETPLPCPEEQMANYAFASSLLGVRDKNNYIQLLRSYNKDIGDWDPLSHVKKLHNIDIGEPLGDYYKITGTNVYTRDFTKLKVLVNPTSTLYTITLDQEYETLDGQKVSGQFTVNPHTGEILKKTSGTTTQLIEHQITINSGNVIDTNKLSLGMQLSYGRIKQFPNTPQYQQLAREADFKLIRLFDFQIGFDEGFNHPCTYWDEARITGTFDWTYVDAAVQEIYDMGAEPLIALGFVGHNNGFPSGMTIDYTTNLPFPYSFSLYAAEWVRHFKQKGWPVRYYEIINEPWIGGRLNTNQKIDNYMNLFNAAAQRMRAENSNILLGFDGSIRRHILDYWLNNGGADLDFISYHKYDMGGGYNIYTDAEIFNRAETRELETDSFFYGVDDAKQTYYNARGKMLPVIDSESNFNSYYEDGTDPKTQKMSGAVWLALKLRAELLKGVEYSVYFHLAESQSWSSTKPSGGFGNVMVNADDKKPYYPYYVQKMIGPNLAVGDSIVDSSSSTNDIRSLSWINDGKLNILLIHKSTDTKTVSLQGVTGQLSYQKIDDPYNTKYNDNPVPETGTINAGDTITLNGYTVMLLQESALQWYGIGDTYTLGITPTAGNSENIKNAWNNLLDDPLVKKWKFNTVRLAFRFPDMPSATDYPVLNYNILDEVLTLLDSKGYKAIVDCHARENGYFGSSNWYNNWVDLVTRFKNDPRIMAWELYNEPEHDTWDSSLENNHNKFWGAFAKLTDLIRATGDNHIVLWEGCYHTLYDRPADIFDIPKRENVYMKQGFHTQPKNGECRDSKDLMDQLVKEQIVDGFLAFSNKFDGLWNGEMSPRTCDPYRMCGVTPCPIYGGEGELPDGTPVEEYYQIRLINKSIEHGIGFNIWGYGSQTHCAGSCSQFWDQVLTKSNYASHIGFKYEFLNEFHSGRSLVTSGPYYYARTMNFANISDTGDLIPWGEWGRDDHGAMNWASLDRVLNDVNQQNRMLILGLWATNFEDLTENAVGNFLIRLNNRAETLDTYVIWIPAWEFNQHEDWYYHSNWNWGLGTAGSPRYWYIPANIYNEKMKMIRNVRDALNIERVLIASQPDSLFRRIYPDWEGEHDPSPLTGQRVLMNYKEGIAQADIIGCSMYISTMDRSTSPWTNVDSALYDLSVIEDAFDWMHKIHDYIDSSKPFFAFEYNSGYMMYADYLSRANDFFIENTYQQVPEHFDRGLRGISWWIGFSSADSWDTARYWAGFYDGWTP